MPSFPLLSTLGYVFLLLVTICAMFLSCVALLSQSVRTSPRRDWKNNFNAVVIGAAYVLVLVISLLFCVKRRIAVRLRMSRINKDYKLVTKDDMPNTVHEYIIREYLRSCLIASISVPTSSSHPGWGLQGTKYDGVEFRSKILSTVRPIDDMAHLVIPHHPPLKPHVRLVHHFRFIAPLLPPNALALWDSAVQMAKLSEREMSQEEFELGWEAAIEIKRALDETRQEMSLLTNMPNISTTALGSSEDLGL
ncbi:hypothetical protein CYLTODRAFT_407097 [Cylindrobasidium torrendii FP15055 ss-10]|uniref:Defect at low temperature protein 1 n=1 Tax=Cylindrobasidium torrendii FP15055 ss-10 TaxID=1314674 RepID=A0A0D7BRI9_9AGAR|nr:hypothetical protein CYLTODRAFT_407097 [Cylindrobasidium torrendii FP15055 ss-10]